MSVPASRDEWKERVRENIRQGAELNAAFVSMNALAATIATYGCSPTVRQSSSVP